MQITFTAATLRDLEAQIRAFIGEPATATAPINTAYPVPDITPLWAPPGSRWQSFPGGRIVVGPDGQQVHAPGTQVHNSDPDAEVAGAALLQSTQGY